MFECVLMVQISALAEVCIIHVLLCCTVLVKGKKSMPVFIIALKVRLYLGFLLKEGARTKHWTKLSLFMGFI